MATPHAVASGNKPMLNFWQIWNMSFGFLGIQFGWGLQMANMSAIYEKLGANADEIPMLWLAAPLTGLIVQPIIGYMSDTTWTSFGRRKPYFLVGAVLASLALIAMPNSSSLWMAAGLLWIMDASINISMEPFRAFVADMLPSQQQTRGYAMQSVFIGAGAVIASCLPWIFTNLVGLKTDPAAVGIPLNVKLSFYIGAFAFLGAVLWTIYRTKEYPPENMEKFLEEKRIAQAEGFLGRMGRTFKEIRIAIGEMPKVMKQLALVQLFTWPGLFLMWFYFGTAVAYNVLGAPDKSSPLYNEGTEWGGVCFGFYSLVTFVFAFFLPQLTVRFGRKQTHVICLLCGAAGLLSVGFIHDKYMLLLSMTGVGIAWSSILSMPYSILVKHLPPNKLGIFVGIFNFFIVLPEIMAALFFGSIMENVLDNNRVSAVMLGGCLLIIAALLTLRVRDDAQEA
jgi:maltose/moltooligosaccharide transporter